MSFMILMFAIPVILTVLSGFRFLGAMAGLAAGAGGAALGGLGALGSAGAAGLGALSSAAPAMMVGSTGLQIADNIARKRPLSQSLAPLTTLAVLGNQGMFDSQGNQALPTNQAPVSSGDKNKGISRTMFSGGHMQGGFDPMHGAGLPGLNIHNSFA